MRVLFSTYPWAFETPGGGEIQLKKYAEHLPAHGIEVRLHDPWRANLAEVAAVHFFSCIGGSVHFCNYVHQRGLPLVISSSLWMTPETADLYPVDEIRSQLSLADVVVTNSDTESDLLSRVLGLPHDRFMTVMNGFEPRFLQPQDPDLFRTAFGIEGPFILNVGNIEPRKNQLGLVRALAGHPLPLVLLGHQRDKAYASELLAEGGSRVRHLGALDHADPLLASAFGACSAFVLPSTLETPGLAALEAAASGAPVVVTSEGSTRDYFGCHAHYVDHRDPLDIRRGIDAAVTQGRTSDLKAHVASRFGWPTVTERLVEVYSVARRRLAAR
ncbi:MAG: glycosyltransferase [Bradyrhizobium sp.]|uniref:glycosyltransferase n=1 Tax=Bradyrhizobium sp. TaxID=376 RepID=UPI001216843E|nr:glycosyltransferase [Bradyrhizobium sp.]THD73088.1 MAG: glycosyltransferase [Bradyrhizobium sp.]